MAYENPDHIRDHVIKVRLNTPLHELITRLAKLNKKQKSTYAFELLEKQLERELLATEALQQTA